MNRREILKALPGVAMIPIAGEKAFRLEQSGEISRTQYLFVVSSSGCDVHNLLETLSGMGIEGAVVVDHDSDPENFCRIYKLED
jgi:hypothetical protein